MPLTHISIRAGKPEAYRQAIFDSLYRALRETSYVPEDNQFMTITEHDANKCNAGLSKCSPDDVAARKCAHISSASRPTGATMSTRSDRSAPVAGSTSRPR